MVIRFAGNLVLLVWILELTSSSVEAKQLSGCPTGCTACSPYNGCLSCKPRHYLLLYRSGMKHLGICTRACPVGYFENRSNGFYRCSECRVDKCSACFGKDYCGRCFEPYFAFHGTCVLQCPPDMYADERNGDCKPTVDCTVTQWTSWSMCTKMGKTCGYKYGSQMRIREIITYPTPNGVQCPILTEDRRCRLRVRYCPGQIPKRSSKLKNPKNSNKGNKNGRKTPKSQRTPDPLLKRKKKRRTLQRTRRFTLIELTE